MIERLLDGSYLSEIYESQKARRHGTGTRVRVIEYRVSAAQAGAGTGTDAPQRYRLITHLLDPASAPAAELAALYQRRWKIETAFAQLKTQLGEALALRSKTPELVVQEFYALLMAHAAIRRLMSAAAIRTDQASEDLSFVHTLNVLRRRRPAQARLPP